MFGRNYKTSLYKGRVNTARDDYDCVVLLAKKFKSENTPASLHAAVQSPQMTPVRGSLSSSAGHM